MRDNEFLAVSLARVLILALRDLDFNANWARPLLIGDLIVAWCHMTVSEASRKIGVSISKMYQLVSGRKISHYRVGGQILLDEGDIATFLASCRVPRSERFTAQPRISQPKLKHLSLR